MANITVHEFFELPDDQGELSWPEDVKGTVADSGTYTLRQETVFAVLTTDADCRVSFNGDAAVASGMNLLSSVPNTFRINPAANRVLKFA